jgi:lysyl-tRNA synthetase, class II
LEFEPLDQYQFDWTHTAKQVVEQFGERTAEQLEPERVNVRVAGRIVALRPHGKAAFAHLAGDGGRLQIYVSLDVVDEQAFKLFQLLDLGDIIGVSGHLFRTKTNKLTVRALFPSDWVQDACK